MKTLAMLVGLTLVGCASQVQNSSPYMVEALKLNIEYPVFVAADNDTECDRQTLARNLCKGFTTFSIEKGQSISEAMNVYTIRCSK